MSTIAEDIGQRIRAYRLRRGLTQEELAEKADLHPTYIGQVERGGKNMTILSMEKLFEALDVSFSEFFEHFGQKSERNGIASKCYTLINSKSKSEQKLIYDILLDIDRLME